MLIIWCRSGSLIKDQLQWDTRCVFVVTYFQLVLERGCVGDKEVAAVLAGAHVYCGISACVAVAGGCNSHNQLVA